MGEARKYRANLHAARDELHLLMFKNNDKIAHGAVNPKAEMDKASCHKPLKMAGPMKTFALTPHDGLRSTNIIRAFNPQSYRAHVGIGSRVWSLGFRV